MARARLPRSPASSSPERPGRQNSRRPNAAPAAKRPRAKRPAAKRPRAKRAQKKPARRAVREPRPIPPTPTPGSPPSRPPFIPISPSACCSSKTAPAGRPPLPSRAKCSKRACTAPDRERRDAPLRLDVELGAGLLRAVSAVHDPQLQRPVAQRGGLDLVEQHGALGRARGGCRVGHRQAAFPGHLAASEGVQV